FTQVYSRGWRRVRELATGNSGAAGLYALFAEHIDPTCGAVICDQQFLADHMKVTTRTIRSWLAYLEENRALVRIPVAGRVCAYALDPHEVWKGYDNAKEYAAFVTKTLVNKDGDIRRRIMSMFSPEERPNDDRDPNTLDMFEGTPHNEQRNEGENLYEKNVRSCCHDGGNRSESCFSGG
ncbi:hypothetical protein, partial [Mycobacterium tuberculosis]